MLKYRFLVLATICILGLDSFYAVEPLSQTHNKPESKMAVQKLKSHEDNSKYFLQFQDVFNKVDKYYVKEIDRQKMLDSAISGMLLALDPHSNYMTDDDLKEFLTNTKGEFGGIGVEIMYDQGAIKIISPIDDLPAQKAGIKAGEYITFVEGESVSNIGFNESVKKMRGAVGTKVKITVYNEEEGSSKEYELTRELVKVKVVKYHMEDDIAYLRLTQFNENSISELKKAIAALKSKPQAKINGIILDLRNNPGGLLDQAVAVSEFFIDRGTIVSIQGKDGKQLEKYTASSLSAKAPKVPLVVLINHGSASASEIVAGAIQDHKRGVALGTQSFGKGSVQTFMSLDQRSAMKLTTAIYYTPTGRSIQAEGIIPDIKVEPLKIEYNKGEDGKRISEKSLKNHLSVKNKDKQKDNKDQEKSKGNSQENENSTDEGTKSKQGTEKSNKLEQDKKDADQDKMRLSDMYYKDYQYARAFDLLKGLSMLSGDSQVKDKASRALEVSSAFEQNKDLKDSDKSNKSITEKDANSHSSAERKHR